MRTHPYLRAYMAGITVPTMVLLLLMAANAAYASFAGEADHIVAGIEVSALQRVLIFPMAVVPNLWGAWNALYLAVHRRMPSWPLGLHGTLLVPILMSLALMLLRALGLVTHLFVPPPLLILIVMTIYYLLWKFVVGFLNREIGIA